MILGKNLNSTFGKVIVRNVPESKKRLDNFERSANSIELEYEVSESIRGDLYIPSDFKIKQRPQLYPTPSNQYYVGNFLSLLRVHLDALSKRYESYIVCDDDTVFHNLRLKYIKDYLPINWDIIVLGRMCNTIFEDYSDREFEPTFITPKITDLAGSQCIAVNKKCYYPMLEHMLSFNEHHRMGDMMLDDLMHHKNIKVYLMLPDITLQDTNSLKPYTLE